MQSFVIFLLMLFFTRLKVPRSRMVTICVYPFISRPEHSTKAHRILEWMTNEGGNELIIHKKKEGSQGDIVCPLLPKWYEYKKHKVALESWIQLFFKCLQLVFSVPLKNSYFAILKSCYDARNVDQIINGYHWEIKPCGIIFKFQLFWTKFRISWFIGKHRSSLSHLLQESIGQAHHGCSVFAS